MIFAIAAERDRDALCWTRTQLAHDRFMSSTPVLLLRKSSMYASQLRTCSIVCFAPADAHRLEMCLHAVECSSPVPESSSETCNKASFPLKASSHEGDEPSPYPRQSGVLPGGRCVLVAGLLSRFIGSVLVARGYAGPIYAYEMLRGKVLQKEEGGTYGCGK